MLTFQIFNFIHGHVHAFSPKIGLANKKKTSGILVKKWEVFNKRKLMLSPTWKEILVSTFLIITEHFKRALFIHLTFFTYSLLVLIILYMLSPYFHFKSFYLTLKCV